MKIFFLQENGEWSKIDGVTHTRRRCIAMPTPKSDKPWRRRKIRVSHLEDTLMRILDSINDPESRLIVHTELSQLRAKEKVMHEERIKLGKSY